MPPCTGTVPEVGDADCSIDEMNKLGLRILTLGIPPGRYLGRIGPPHILLYSFIILTVLTNGLYELLGSLFLSEGELLDLMSHMYLVVCYFTFFFHWVYLLRNYRTFYEDGLDFKKFSCSVKVKRAAKQIMGQKAKEFFKRFVIYCTLVGFSTGVYIVGAVVDISVALKTKGRVDEIFFMAYFPIPLWAQWVTFVMGVFTLLGAFALMATTFVITGLQALTIQTQCEILCKAFSASIGESELEVEMRTNVRDHVELIKHAKRYIRTCKILNNPMFFMLYMMMAIQLFVISVTKPTGGYYFSITFDIMNCLVILFSQCWFSSMVTDSLQSIANGVYGAPWYGRKSCRAEVVLITQMAQRPFIQSLWFDSLRVERATILSMIQSSYSFYTMLLILQNKK